MDGRSNRCNTRNSRYRASCKATSGRFGSTTRAWKRLNTTNYYSSCVELRTSFCVLRLRHDDGGDDDDAVI